MKYTIQNAEQYKKNTELRRGAITRIKSEIDYLKRDLEQLEHMEKVEGSDKNFNRYLNTYSGKRLLETHSLDEYGTWAIHGEDPNCDLGGSHIEPYLATLEGKLGDVIKEAVAMGSFWQWGGGGSIRKVKVEKV